MIRSPRPDGEAGRKRENRTETAEAIRFLPDVEISPGELGRGRLCQILAYGRKVYDLPRLLETIDDRRKNPQVPAGQVAQTVFLAGLLRIRSFNALEPRLSEATFAHVLGKPFRKRPLCSADTLGYSLQRMDVSSARSPAIQVIQKAERNKAFREGWVGALRYVALDGWEPFCSRSRHCAACLTRNVRDGDQTVTEYYHRFVVALLVHEGLEVALDMEQIRSADLRKEAGEKKVEGHEGELTAAKRLVPRLRSTYGRWLEVFLVDALYANGPFLTVAKQSGFGVIVVLKKETDEPLKDALEIWSDQPPEKVVVDVKEKERIELWDCSDLETLTSYAGSIRVVRAVVHKLSETAPKKSGTWCFGVTGVPAKRLSAAQVVRAGRGRWHLENTGFNQWTQHWKFEHVFTHGSDALPALFWLFLLAFNLQQLFVFRQIGGYGRLCGKDVTRTLIRLADGMLGDLERLTQPIAWDTS